MITKIARMFILNLRLEISVGLMLNVTTLWLIYLEWRWIFSVQPEQCKIYLIKESFHNSKKINILMVLNITNWKILKLKQTFSMTTAVIVQTWTFSVPVWSIWNLLKKPLKRIAPARKNANLDLLSLLITKTILRITTHWQQMNRYATVLYLWCMFSSNVFNLTNRSKKTSKKP